MAKHHEQKRHKLWLAQGVVEPVVQHGNLVSSYPHLDHQVALMNFPLVLAGAYPSQLQESGGSQSRQYAVDLAKVNLG